MCEEEELVVPPKCPCQNCLSSEENICSAHSWSGRWGWTRERLHGPLLAQGLLKKGREEATKVPSTQGLELGCYLYRDVPGELTECGALAGTGRQTVQQTGWDCHKSGCNGKEGQVRVCCTQRGDAGLGQEPQSSQP